MADLDLATILADGEYLRRVGDTLVGDIPAGGGGGGSTILDGTGPPDVALGAAGNYYEDTTAGILYGPKTVSGWGLPQRPTIASAPSATAVSDETGARYRFARHGKVTGCRYQRYSGAVTTLTIKAWRDSTTSKVAEVADTQAAVTGTFTVTFPSPVPVQAGETWTFTQSGTTTSRHLSVQAVTNTADVTFIDYRFHATVDNYPTTVTSETYFVEPIFESNDAWPVTVRTVATAQTVTDPELAAIAGLTSAADQVPYFTGSGTAALATMTSAARTVLDDTTVAAMRTTLGVPSIARTITTYSGTATTGALSDAGCYLRFTGTNPTYTVPPNSTVAFPVGTQIDGIGTTTAMTLVQGSGVTITKARTLVTLGAGSAWTLIKTATDAWDLIGDFL